MSERDLTDAERYCLGELAARDSHRAFLARLAPAGRQGALAALYAFNLEVARTREAVSEAMLGEIRLQWWRDALEEAFSGAPRRHQVVLALAKAVRGHALDRGLLEALVEARAADLAAEPFATLDALDAYAGATSSGLLRAGLSVLGLAEGRGPEAAEAVGRAYALAGMMRALPFLRRAGRFVIPADVAREAGLPARDEQDLRDGPALRAAVRAVCLRAQAHLAAARDARRAVPGAALPVLGHALFARDSLNRLEAADYNVLDASLAPARRPPLGVLWAAWRGRWIV